MEDTRSFCLQLLDYMNRRTRVHIEVRKSTSQGASTSLYTGAIVVRLSHQVIHLILSKQVFIYDPALYRFQYTVFI